MISPEAPKLGCNLSTAPILAPNGDGVLSGPRYRRMEGSSHTRRDWSFDISILINVGTFQRSERVSAISRYLVDLDLHTT